jgi:hypothetical protein
MRLEGADGAADAAGRPGEAFASPASAFARIRMIHTTAPG